MKEVRDFELLKQIKEEAKIGLNIINERLKILEETEDINEIVSFKIILEEVIIEKGSKEKMKEIINVDAIPLYMLVLDERWSKLQRLIFKLHADEI